MVRQCIMGEGVVLFNRGHNKGSTFVSVWGASHSRTNARRWSAFYHSRELWVFAQIIQKDTGTDVVKGFCISVAEIQKWKEGCTMDWKMKMGQSLEKSAILRQESICAVAVLYGIGACHEGFLKDVPYPFSNKKEKGLVSIPKSAKRKQSFLNVSQMTELYNLFCLEEIPRTLVGRYNETRTLFIGTFPCPVPVQYKLQYGWCRTIDLR